MHPVRGAATAALTLALVACSGEILSTCACSRVAPGVTIRGAVTAPGGASAEGATVRVERRRGDCAAPGSAEGEVPVRDGGYRIVVSVREADECLRVVAHPAPGSALLPSLEAPVSVAAAVVDSAVVNLALRAGP